MKNSILIRLLLVTLFASIFPATSFAQCGGPHYFSSRVYSKGRSIFVTYADRCFSETPEKVETFKLFRFITISVRPSNKPGNQITIWAKTWPEKNQELLAEKILAMEFYPTDEQADVVVNQIAPVLEDLAIEKDEAKILDLKKELKVATWAYIQKRYPNVDFDTKP